ncbi:MAG TPA: type I methionyl aminopeptidase [Thermoanaerobaculia bacterium]|jgi:methionyl aminopeptidase
MTIKRQDERDGLEAVGRVVAATLAAMRNAVTPGVSTRALDDVAERVFAAHGARPAPRLVYGFPGVTCISVNDEIVHGIPGGRRLEPGDVVKLDVTAEKDGLMADAARTVVVEPRTPVSAALAACVHEAFRRALAVVRPGNPIRWIGREVEKVARGFGFSVVPELSGHGIGRTIHEAPAIPNFDDPLCIGRLREGLVFTIEPIVTAGSGASRLDADGWTIRTSDRSLAAHYEETLLVTADGARILTA